MAKFDLEIDGKIKSTTKGNELFYYGGGNEAWASVAAAKAGVPSALRSGRTVGVLVANKIVEYVWHPEDITDNGLVVKSVFTGESLISQGNWNANTNTPDISATTETGFFWIVTTPGTTNLGGIAVWGENDWAVKTASGWAKVDNQNKVISVAGKIGVVTLQAADITDFTSAVNALITGKLNTGGYPGTANDLKSLIDVLTIIINNEISARTQQVVDLQADIDAEIANRIAQDAAEVVLRTNADAALQAQVDTKITKNDAGSETKFFNEKGIATEVPIALTDENISSDFYLDENGKLNANVVPFEQTFDYVSGLQIFTLASRVIRDLKIFLNGSYLDPNDYVFTDPTQIEVLPTMAVGSRMHISYLTFVNEPV